MQSRFYVAAGIITWAACSGADKPATQPTTASPNTPAPARIAKLVPMTNDAGLFIMGSPAAVGRLVENSPLSMMHPSEFCLDDGHLYAGAQYRLGGLNIFGYTTSTAAPGALALVFGSIEEPLLAALTDRGSCPPGYGDDAPHVQMRSDWVSPEGGFRTTRDKLRGLSYVQASSMHALTLHRVVEDAPAKDGHVTVALLNPFDTSLDGLTARVHYEGGPGKSMAKYVPLTLALPPGGTQTLTIPTSVEGGPAGADTGTPRGIYRLHSIDLEGTVAQTRFDVNLFIKIPRRGPAKR